MKPLCTAPFTDFGIAAESYSSCCMSYIRYNDTDASSALNNKTITDVREAMIEHRFDDLPDSCKYCISSDLQHRFQQDNAVISTNVSVSDVRNLILYPSNECSGACIMCGDEFSRTYSKQYNPEQIQNIDNIDECIQSINDVTGADTIRILGGNLQDMKRGTELVESLIDADVNEVTIVTNGNSSTMRDGSDFFTHMFNLHMSGKHVRLVISIDGVEDVNNVQRRFINYNRLCEFISKAKTYRSMYDVSLLATITLYNIERFPELTSAFPDIEIGIGFISMPTNMAMSNAHPDFMKHSISVMQNADDCTANRRVLNELKSVQSFSKYSHVNWLAFCKETLQKAKRKT